VLLTTPYNQKIVLLTESNPPFSDNAVHSDLIVSEHSGVGTFEARSGSSPTMSSVCVAASLETIDLLLEC
jgi:hypothetical protein